MSTMKLVCKMSMLALLIAVSAGCDAMTEAGKLKEMFGDARVVELVQAAEDDNAEKVMQLRSNGVDINARGTQGITPLVYVMRFRDRKAAELLLKAGADPNQKIDNGNAPIWLAAGRDDQEMLMLMLKYGGNPNILGGNHDEESALMLAVSNGLLKNIDLLLAHGADINYIREIENSAATLASAIGRMDIVVHLLEKGYSHNLRDLAISVDSSIVSPESGQQPWKEKALRMLEQRGVKFPLPPDPNLAGTR